MEEDESARLKEHTHVVALHTVYALFNLLYLFCGSNIRNTCCEAFKIYLCSKGLQIYKLCLGCTISKCSDDAKRCDVVLFKYLSRQTFSIADTLTCHIRKSTGVNISVYRCQVSVGVSHASEQPCIITGLLNWKWNIAPNVDYTCAFPAMMFQNICCEKDSYTDQSKH